MRRLFTTTREQPLLATTREKPTQQQRPSIAKKKKTLCFQCRGCGFDFSKNDFAKHHKGYQGEEIIPDYEMHRQTDIKDTVT